MRRSGSGVLRPEEIRKEAIGLFEKHYKGIELSEVVVRPGFDQDGDPVVYVHMVYDAELDEFLEASKGGLANLRTELWSKLGEDPDRYPGFPMVTCQTRMEYEEPPHDAG